jgi:hypothetical protein
MLKRAAVVAAIAVLQDPARFGFKVAVVLVRYRYLKRTRPATFDQDVALANVLVLLADQMAHDEAELLG